MLQGIRDVFQQYREKISYLVAGVMTTLVAWSSYALFIYAGYSINVSNIFSWMIAVTFAYLVNKIFVFQTAGWGISQVLKEAVAFIGSRLATGIIEIALVPILVWLGITQSLLGIEGFYAKFIAGLLPLVINYILGKKVVFHMKNPCVNNFDANGKNADGTNKGEI